MLAFRKVLSWVLAIFGIYLIIELARKLLGGSLGFQELAIALLVANLGYSFHNNSRISEVNSKISGHIGWHKGKDSGRMV